MDGRRPARLPGVSGTFSGRLVVPRLRRVSSLRRTAFPTCAWRPTRGRRPCAILRTRAVSRLSAERQPSTGCAPRAERSEFARLLDRAIPGDATILEIGCGTGQMSLYLARADRTVVGADLTRASLQLGGAAARRFGVERGAFRRDRSQPAGARRRRVRRRLFVGRSAPHARSARRRSPASRGWRNRAE